MVSALLSAVSARLNRHQQPNSTLVFQVGIRWRPDRSAAFVAALKVNADLQGQFEQAIVEKDL